ncbi:RNA polymerase sigma factor [Paenibacillus sp. sgz5001063]|uniref:RNA polymerase sigma factor n=1 Tax=Paenibacillus sp. sgz5001063 TaxID=3242474 RepID=UPI0036D3C2BC
MVDAELYHIIHLARGGDQEAFAELVRRYKGHVYRYAVGMLTNRMDAEDVSQEAFVKAFYSLPGLDNEYAFSSWMMTIVSNLCKDRLKKNNKEQEFRDEPNERIEDSGISDPVAKLSVEESLGRLSVDHREVILLHDVQGYKYEEIASLLDVPIGTVKSRLFAARMSLRRELAEEDQE